MKKLTHKKIMTTRMKRCSATTKERDRAKCSQNDSPEDRSHLSDFDTSMFCLRPIRGCR